MAALVIRELNNFGTLQNFHILNSQYRLFRSTKALSHAAMLSKNLTGTNVIDLLPFRGTMQFLCSKNNPQVLPQRISLRK